MGQVRQTACRQYVRTRVKTAATPAPERPSPRGSPSARSTAPGPRHRPVLSPESHRTTDEVDGLVGEPTIPPTRQRAVQVTALPAPTPTAEPDPASPTSSRTAGTRLADSLRVRKPTASPGAKTFTSTTTRSCPARAASRRRVVTSTRPVRPWGHSPATSVGRQSQHDQPRTSVAQPGQERRRIPLVVTAASTRHDSPRLAKGAVIACRVVADTHTATSSPGDARRKTDAANCVLPVPPSPATTCVTTAGTPDLHALSTAAARAGRSWKVSASNGRPPVPATARNRTDTGIRPDPCSRATHVHLRCVHPAALPDRRQPSQAAQEGHPPSQVGDPRDPLQASLVPSPSALPLPALRTQSDRCRTATDRSLKSNDPPRRGASDPVAGGSLSASLHHQRPWGPLRLVRAHPRRRGLVA
jgi:hypothetical protein